MLSLRAARLLLLPLAGTLAIAPSASAAVQRYATPNGSGTACTSASPCSLAQAVNGAGVGAEVIVGPGDYAVTETLQTVGGNAIHGVAGQPRPRLLFSGANQWGIRVTGNSSLRWVEVDQAPGSDASAIYSQSSLVDQVIAKAAGAGVTAYVQSGTIRNSIVIASGATGYAIATDTTGAVNHSTYRNVTAIASGANGVAIQVRAGFPSGVASADLINVISRGSKGLQATTDNSGAHATITIDHTNYLVGSKVGTNAAIVDGGANQTLSPSFVDWAAGDYREAFGSDTVNAGVNDPANGTLDVEGDPRTIGTTDIGADELVPAPAIPATGPASEVTDRSATLTGTLAPNGVPTEYHFEYGPTAAYGDTTPSVSAGAGPGAVSAAASLAGLNPFTTYHFRLVASNTAGVTKGPDATFTTSPEPAPPAAPAPGAPAFTPAPAFAGVRLVSTTLSFDGRFLTLKLTCPAATAGRCAGITKVTARRRGRPAAALGQARFSIAAGRRGTVKLRVSATGRRLLAHPRRLAATDTSVAHDATGATKATAARVTIRPRHG